MSNTLLVPKGVSVDPEKLNQNPQPNKPVKPKTKPSEWVVLAIIFVIVIIVTLIIFLVLKPQLFQSTSPPNSDPITNPKGCPTSPPPSNIIASQVLLTRASIDLNWTPVLTTTTPGEQILGYNIYINKSPAVTKTNSGTGIFTPVALKRLYKDGFGSNLLVGITYYINISTVDSCGNGELVSTNEISFTPTFPI